MNVTVVTHMVCMELWRRAAAVHTALMIETPSAEGEMSMQSIRFRVSLVHIISISVSSEETAKSISFEVQSPLTMTSLLGSVRMYSASVVLPIILPPAMPASPIASNYPLNKRWAPLQ